LRTIISPMTRAYRYMRNVYRVPPNDERMIFILSSTFYRDYLQYISFLRFIIIYIDIGITIISVKFLLNIYGFIKCIFVSFIIGNNNCVIP
jgi:hypothetical protein